MPWARDPKRCCAGILHLHSSRGCSSRGETTIQARGADLRVQTDGQGRSWALVADLLECYEIPYVWDASRRRILIGALDVTPIYRDDAVQASVGWNLVELSLQTGNAPVMLTGILRPGPTVIGPGAGCWNSPRSLRFRWPSIPWCWLSAGAGEVDPLCCSGLVIGVASRSQFRMTR